MRPRYRCLLTLSCLSLMLALHGVPAATAAFAAAAKTKKLPPLHAQGRNIVDAKGNTVLLRGVNIGGWLVTEGWMCGQKDKNDRKALEQLEARFGAERAGALMTAWQSNWFTAKDLDTIQSFGFNMIRVPFSYRTLLNAEGNWKRDQKGKVNFSRMDWVVEQASQRGIYVIFDLHVWPGEYGWVSRHTPEGAKVRADMATLWGEIARHYRGVDAIAAMDIINEPEGSPGNAPHHAFYDAIRRQDPRRMIVIEWISYPDIAKEGWSNIVWSSHYPENSLKSGSVEERIARFEEKERLTTAGLAPVFIGEMKAPQDTAESAAELAHALNRRGWNWAVWTYKGVSNGGWAAFNYYDSLKYDLASDSYESVLQKWAAGFVQWQAPDQPRNHYLTQWWIDGFGKGAREAVSGKASGRASR